MVLLKTSLTKKKKQTSRLSNRLKKIAGETCFRTRFFIASVGQTCQDSNIIFPFALRKRRNNLALDRRHARFLFRKMEETTRNSYRKKKFLQPFTFASNLSLSCLSVVLSVSSFSSFAFNASSSSCKTEKKRKTDYINILQCKTFKFCASCQPSKDFGRRKELFPSLQGGNE